MGGASSKEVKQGTAVTGRYCKRVPLPAGVIGQQMSGGMRPGAKFRAFTPTLLEDFLGTQKGGAELYAEFKREVSEDCGGENIKGWQSAAVQQKVTKFQPRFNEIGLRVTYNMVMWQQWVPNGQYGGHMQTMYKYWMTYAEMSVPVVTLQADAYDPQQDYSKADGVVTAAGTPLTGEVGQLVQPESYDPVGEWTLDVDSQSNPSASLKEGSMRISHAGPAGDADKRLRVVGSAKFPILCFNKTIAWDESLERSSTNVFVGSTQGSMGAGETTIELALTSPTALTATSASRHGTYRMTYNKVVRHQLNSKEQSIEDLGKTLSEDSEGISTVID